MKQLPELQISDLCGVNLSAMCGQGLIQPWNNSDIKCTVACERQFTAEGMDYSQVFAVVQHPKYGVVALGNKEHDQLGIPELTQHEYDNALALDRIINLTRDVAAEILSDVAGRLRDAGLQHGLVMDNSEYRNEVLSKAAPRLFYLAEQLDTMTPAEIEDQMRREHVLKEGEAYSPDMRWGEYHRQANIINWHLETHGVPAGDWTFKALLAARM